MSSDRFNALIEKLAQAETAPDAYNEYAYTHPNNAIRRTNLLRYFVDISARQPDTLMVMEAPGYRGCRLTGVPVTSRKILLEGVPDIGLFGADNGYQDTDEVGFERVYGEQSATIVWGTLAELGVTPVIWNTFPFHPHKPDQLLTNRKPRKPEMDLGAEFLREVIALFQPKKVIAVGNVAHDTLTGMSVECHKVRHPAQGGKNDFVAGMTALFT